MHPLSEIKVAVIGLGYVGLPLSIEFGKKRKTFGFDINTDRIDNLKKGIDSTREITKQQFSEASNLEFTSSIDDIKHCQCYIVTVPTPIDENNKPNLNPLIEASKTVGKLLSTGDIVIYESTVFPGCTEEICVPILEKNSGLKYINQDIEENDEKEQSGFYCGYSPERINPGDNEHKITNIKKVTSGSNQKISQLIDDLYQEIIAAGTFNVGSIKIAEAAKVIENTQRDLNIAFMNELSIIFDKMGIDTSEVIEAASTKWNFLPFKPGLVGGHCIGVDPYYLTYKSESLGYQPKVILSGREINDSMGNYVAKKLIKKLEESDIKVQGSKVLIVGFSFKENCPDIRNTKVIDIVHSLNKNKLKTDIYDPWVDSDEVKREHAISCLASLPTNQTYDAVIVATVHREFDIDWILNLKKLCKDKFIFFDLKSVLPKSEADFRL